MLRQGQLDPEENDRWNIALGVDLNRLFDTSTYAMRFTILLYLPLLALSTEDKLEYNFYPVASGQIQFRIKAPNDAHVALTTGPQEGDPMYEVSKI